MYGALGVTTVLYVLIALGVFGTLTVTEVVGYGETAIAEAARPALGDFGFTMMAIAAPLATSSSVNATLYASGGLTVMLAQVGQFPTFFGRGSRPVRTPDSSSPARSCSSWRTSSTSPRSHPLAARSRSSSSYSSASPPTACVPRSAPGSLHGARRDRRYSNRPRLLPSTRSATPRRRSRQSSRSPRSRSSSTSSGNARPSEPSAAEPLAAPPSAS